MNDQLLLQAANNIASGISRLSEAITGLLASVGYPTGASPITGASGNVAASTATATLDGAVGKVTYIMGFDVTSSGSTGAGVVNLTVTGGISGTLTFNYASLVGATVPNAPLSIRFPQPIPASAVNTPISVVLPSLGAGNTHATVNAYGFRL